VRLRRASSALRQVFGNVSDLRFLISTLLIVSGAFPQRCAFIVPSLAFARPSSYEAVQNVGAGGQTLTTTRARRRTARPRPMGDALQAKIFFITLAVDDLDRSVAFYRDGLGWPTEGIVGQEFHDEVTGADGTIAFFNLDGGLLLGLYERANLAKDASLPPGPPSSTEFSLGVPGESQAEVDKLLRQVEAAGGTLTAPAHMRPFGVYSGYFTDPDGHLFEIAWNSNE
jgi:catechol 2,3-dioxygenase-like lactoylglutathione lyase family enzyme